ncbi:MAG: hypothetical protein Q4G04_02545 [bacterium]|nr:hypothetical protein [bacterium]
MEVHTSNVFTHKGKYYETFLTDDTPNTTSYFTFNYKKERMRINNKMYHINTNDYQSLTANKMIQVIEYYNRFEKYILDTDKKIIRNYLKKGIVFKYNKRIIEVLIKEKELTIVFLNIVKKYDSDNLGYI